MPQIYDRPAKSLIADWAKANLTPGQTFSKSDVVRWFAKLKRRPRGEAQLLAGAKVLEDILGLRGTTPINPRPPK